MQFRVVTLATPPQFYGPAADETACMDTGSCITQPTLLTSAPVCVDTDGWGWGVVMVAHGLDHM